MGCYRRASAICPGCGKLRQFESEEKNEKLARWRCACGAEVEAPLGVWCIRYHALGKSYRQKVGPSYKDAQAVLGKRLAEIREGRLFDVKKRCQVTLDEFTDTYMEWARGHKRSAERDERSLKFLSVHFGKTLLDEISLAQVEKYKRLRLDGVLKRGVRVAGPATVNRELACLRKLLNLAVDLGTLERNPLAGKLKMLKEPSGRLIYLDPAQIIKLLEACSKRSRPVILLLLATGMRLSEAVGLRWDEVDLARGVIRLPGERTKNGCSRTVPLNEHAKLVLKDADGKRLERCPQVVFHVNGRPIRCIRRAFRGACKRAKLPDGIRLHDLRHCFASALAMRGVPLQAIGELLGQKTASMTQRYAHLSPDMLKRAVEQASAYMHDKLPAGVVRMEKPEAKDGQKPEGPSKDRPSEDPTDENPSTIGKKEAR